MRGLPLLLLAGLAQAQVSVEILGPAPESCLSSGFEAEGEPGGDPFFAPVDLRLQLRLGGEGTHELRVEHGGEVLARGQSQVPPEGLDFELLVGADTFADGPDQAFVVHTEVEGQQAQAELRLEVDRLPPAIVFEEAALEAVDACGPQPAPAYQVVDAADPNPTVEESPYAQDCAHGLRIVATDACGNGQAVTYRARRAPDPLPQPFLEGVEEGARVGEAALRFGHDGAASCVERITGQLLRGEDVLPIIVGQPLRQPGDYTAQVSLVPTCEEDPILIERAFTVLPPPSADPGGPYAAQQGAELILSAANSNIPAELGAITEYAWDLNADGFFDAAEGRAVEVPFDTNQPQGVYPIGLRITTDSGFVDYGYTEVDLQDTTPVCEAGGPYEVAQGAELTIDGSASAAGHPDEPVVYYDWRFGDGRFTQRGIAAQVQHRYEEEGEFTVTLVVGDEDSECQDTALVNVIDAVPEVRNLHARNPRVVEGEDIAFSAGQTSAGAASEPIVEFRWDFGDGGTEAGPELRGPIHTYAESGTYEVCLVVDDGDSTAEGCIEVEVADLQPFVRLDGPRYAVEGDVVAFSAFGSRAGGPEDPIQRYEWDFGDGSEPTLVEGADNTEVEHVFEASGELVLTLRVHDEDGFSERQHEIFVDDVRPNAVLTLLDEPRSLLEGTPVHFDGSGSTPGAPSDPIATYRWDFGDGGEAEGPQAEHAYPDDGSYLVRLHVTDADGSASARELLIEVRNRAPWDVAILGDDVEIEVGTPVRFTLQYTDVRADPPEIRWRMGDGTVFTATLEVEHAWEETGVFVVRALVNDREGGETQVEREVTVLPAGPRVEGPNELSGAEGELLSAQWEIEPARLDREVFDGPVEVDVRRAPSGAVWRLETLEEGPLQRLHLEWQPGLGSGGEHRVDFVVRAPSGIERSRQLILRVEDRGEALLAASHDTRVSLYSYAHDGLRGVDVFETQATLQVGGASGGLAASADGRWLFAAVTGTGHVAVVDTARGALVRRIPTGGQPFAMASTEQEVFAFDLGGDRLWRIDPQTLKVVGRARTGIDGLTDGLVAERRLIVASERERALYVLDFEGDVRRRLPLVTSIAGQAPVDHAPRRLYAEGDALWVLAGRSALQLSLAAVLDGALEAEVFPMAFAGRDVAVVEGVPLVATAAGLLALLEPAGYRLRGALNAVAPLPSTLLGQAGLALGSPDRVRNAALPDLADLGSARSGEVRRLLPFAATR